MDSYEYERSKGIIENRDQLESLGLLIIIAGILIPPTLLFSFPFYVYCSKIVKEREKYREEQRQKK